MIYIVVIESTYGGTALIIKQIRVGYLAIRLLPGKGFISPLGETISSVKDTCDITLVVLLINLLIGFTA